MRPVATMIAAAVAVVGVALVAMAAGSEKRQPAPPPVLEIDMKTHLADAMAASTYDLEGVRINPGDSYQQITLTAFRNGRDGHYLLRLRDGAQVATIPYFPIYGNLFVSGSLLQELDLRFYNFDQVTGDKRPEMAGRGGMNDAVATRPEDDIAPIVAIYRQLESFGWTRFLGHCFHNRFPDSEPAACPEKLRFDPASGQTLENLLTRYIAEVRQASAAQDYARLDRIKGAVLGGWIMSDGTLVWATVFDRRDASGGGGGVTLDQQDFNLALHINMQSQYAALQANALSRCFRAEDGISRYPRSYTPEQAAEVFSALYDALGPPELGEELITDPLRQERFAWGLERLPYTTFSHTTYFTSRAWDRHFTLPREPGGRMLGQLMICDQLSALEQAAGITP